MNDIITPITEDRQIGFDSYGQLVSWEPKADGGKIGTVIHDMRKEICGLCGRGWELTGPSMRNQFYLRTVELWVHQTCYLGYLTIEEKSLLYSCLASASESFYEQALIGWNMEKIANEYGGAWNTPWYQVAFRRFPKDRDRRKDDAGYGTGFVLKFGPRKRVYHMSLHNPGFDFRPFHPITEDNVTKEAGSGYLLVHAWTRDDVKKYLGAMMKVVVENTSEP